MSMITTKDRAANNGKVETAFFGKNLTTVGGMGLFHRFVQKLGVEEALEQSVKLPGSEGKYTEGRMLLALIYASVLDLSHLSDTLLLRLDKVFHKIVHKFLPSPEHLQSVSSEVYRSCSKEDRRG